VNVSECQRAPSMEAADPTQDGIHRIRRQVVGNALPNNSSTHQAIKAMVHECACEGLAVEVDCALYNSARIEAGRNQAAMLLL
jgi:hypothetical protein